MSSNRKIVTADQLRHLRDAARAAGKTVVHCHGCFDIVHPGHIHHLQYARSLGQILLVSVSADTHVNKGVDRPLIPDDLRAASLAALECVDWVYVNPQPTAVELLNWLQPDIYVKGREYEQNQDPRFLAERDAVTHHGGRVVFSSGDVVYSSTALIGGLQSKDDFHDEKIARLRDRYGLSNSNLQNLIHRFRGKRVLVIGDYILDRYHFCDASGVAGEAPMMALRSLQQHDYDGGAAVVALHLAGLGASPTLLTAFADDDHSRQIEMRVRSAGVQVQALRNRPQIVAKNRYLVDEQKLFKVDEGQIAPLDSRGQNELAEKILSAADDASAVIFADFGYGLITSNLLDRILPTLRQKVDVLTADVSGKQSNLLKFSNVDLLCPTEREARETLHDFSSGLGAVVWNLLKTTSARQAIITLGKQGLVTFDRPDDQKELVGRLRSEYIPALTRYAVDPLGCGDALLATATLALAAGGNLQAAAFLGSIAASIAAQQIGNAPIDADQVTSRILGREPALDAARLAV